MKNKQKQILILCAVSLMSVSSLMAQLKISAEYRPRTEYRHGYKAMVTDKDDAAFATSQRTRLNLSFNSEKVKYQLSLQDIRIWGDLGQLSSTSNQLMLQQGWAEYLFTKECSMKLGRQELDYDDARILGNVDWTQQGRSHDVALFKYEKGFKLHVGLAFNQNSDLLKTTDYTLANNYKSMQFVWFNKKFDKLGLSLLFLNNGLQKNVDTTAYSQTVGTRLTYDLKSVSLFGATYYTMGRDKAWKELAAYYASLGANMKLNEKWSATLGWELLSGTSQIDKTNTKNNSFNPLYGTNHKFNGFMDYFYVGNHLNSVGLNDIYGTLNYKKGKFNVGLTPHYFMAAADVSDAGTKMDKALGTEVDLVAGYKLADNVTLSAGYSQMFGTKTLQKLNAGSDCKATNNWAWVMISFKPDFLK
jgi:hypothetical protein